MVVGYSEVYYGNLKLLLTNIEKTQVPGTAKQKVGGMLVKHQIPGRSVRDWSFKARGVMFDGGTAATTSRRLLEEAHDFTASSYSDGMHTATVIIESLEFDDNSQTPMMYKYNIKFIEFNQVS